MCWGLESSGLSVCLLKVAKEKNDIFTERFWRGFTFITFRKELLASIYPGVFILVSSNLEWEAPLAS
jgi:hypothetical protein